MMQHLLVRTTIVLLFVVASRQITFAENADASSALSFLDRAVVFAVQQEVGAGDLKSRKDLCVGFGNGLRVSEKAIVSELKRNGLKVRPSEWCNHALRGLRIAVLAPISETSPGTYELHVELGDLSPLQRGEHFATLVKRGTYVIRYEGNSEPLLVSCRQTCCP